MIRTVTVSLATAALTFAGAVAVQADPVNDTSGTWGEAEWTWASDTKVLTVTGSTTPGEVSELGTNGSQPWKQQTSGFEAGDVLEIGFVNPERIGFPQDSSFLFSNLHSLTTLTNTSDAKTDAVTDMSRMFENARFLESLVGLEGWDTSNVVSMEGLFHYAGMLKNVDGLENWDTKNVTDMSHMFSRTYFLDNVDGLRKWDTTNVQHMNYMFSDTRELLDVSGLEKWDTGNVVDMSYMFSGAKKLEYINGLTKWDTKNVTDMSHMLEQASDLDNVDGLRNWDTTNVEYMNYMFFNAEKLDDVRGLKRWDTGNVVDMSYMFSGTKKLEDISGLSRWDTKNVADMSHMFQFSESMENVDELGRWDTQNVKDMSCMFQHTDSLLNVDGLSDWTTSKVTDLEGIFAGAFSLKNVDGLKNWDTGVVTNMNGMFVEAEALENVDGLKDWDTGEVTDMSSMFIEAKTLENLDGLKDWDTSEVKNMNFMFAGTFELENLDGLKDWDTSKVTNMSNMFYFTASLQNTRGVRNWDVSNVLNMYDMFAECWALSDVDFSGWDTTAISEGGNARGIFDGTPVEVLILGANTRLDGDAFDYMGLWSNPFPESSWFLATDDLGNFTEIGDAENIRAKTGEAGFNGGKFYLRWNAHLSYNLNGGDKGDCDFDDVTMLSWTKYQLPDCKPVKEEHDFLGWKLHGESNPIGAGEYLTMPSLDTELVAYWKTVKPLSVERFSGADRYATNIAVNAKLRGKGPVFVATGKNFADALSAASAVNSVDGTLFLTESDFVSVKTLAAIKLLEPQSVYIIGGTVAVSENAEAMLQLVTGVAAQRISGSDRYDTSMAIYDQFFTDEQYQYDAVFVATGRDFPDAISASAAAGTLGGPVLLVDGKNDKKLDSKILESLQNHTETILIAGGEKVVNEGLEKSLQDSFDVTRLAGLDRYGTNLAINNHLNEHFGLQGLAVLWVATGNNFPDALSAAVPAGNADVRLVLSPGTCIPSPVVSEWINGENSKVESVNLAGGPQVLSGGVENLTQCAK